MRATTFPLRRRRHQVICGMGPRSCTRSWDGRAASWKTVWRVTRKSRSVSGRRIEDDALGERVSHGVARPLGLRGLFVADDEQLGRQAERAQGVLEPDDLTAVAEAVLLDDEEVEVAFYVGRASGV